MADSLQRKNDAKRNGKVDRRRGERRLKRRRSTIRRHTYCRRQSQYSFDELEFAVETERRIGERREGCRRVYERRSADRRVDERRKGTRTERTPLNPRGFLTREERDYLASLNSSDD